MKFCYNQFMSLKDNIQKGRIGEDIAKVYLSNLGYKNLRRSNIFIDIRPFFK